MIIFILLILAIFISVHFISNKKKIKEGLTEATSCHRWVCSIEDQICPKGNPGASRTSYICKKNKWKPITEAEVAAAQAATTRAAQAATTRAAAQAATTRAAQAANNKCKDKGGLITEEQCKQFAVNKGFDASNKAHYDNTGNAIKGFWDGCQVRDDGKQIFYSAPGSTGEGGQNSSLKPICKHRFDYGQGSINAGPPVAESNDKCSERGGNLSQYECLQFAKSKLNKVTKPTDEYDDTAQANRDGLWDGCQISSQAPEEGKKPKIWFVAKDTTTPAKKHGSNAKSHAICKNDIITGVTQTTAKTCNLKNCIAPIKVDGRCEGANGFKNNNPIQKIINGYKKFFKKCEYKCLRPEPTNQPNYVDTGLWDKDANGALKVKMYGTNSNYNKAIHGCRTKNDCSASCGKVEVEAKGKMKEVTTNGEIKMVWEPEGSGLFFKQNRVGQAVKAKIDGSSTYVNGKIIKTNANGTFDIQFDNGVTKIGMTKSEFEELMTNEEYTSLNGQEARTETATSATETQNKVNAADTTMANMFLDINNPNDVGKKDMSLEDYYNKQLTIKNSENRLGGSKTAYTNRYRPQNKYGNIRFFNSVWKLF